MVVNVWLCQFLDLRILRASRLAGGFTVSNDRLGFDDVENLVFQDHPDQDVPPLGIIVLRANFRHVLSTLRGEFFDPLANVVLGDLIDSFLAIAAIKSPARTFFSESACT